MEIVSSVSRGFGRNGGDWGRWFGGSVWPLEGQGWEVGGVSDANREDRKQVGLWKARRVGRRREAEKRLAYVKCCQSRAVAGRKDANGRGAVGVGSKWVLSGRGRKGPD